MQVKHAALFPRCRMAQMRAASAENEGCVPSSSMAEPKAAGPPPTETSLREAALAYLSRYGTTQAGLVRVLDRKVARWVRAAGEVSSETTAALRTAVRVVAQRLVTAGIVDDTLFAEARVRSLNRAGRSRLVVAAHLAARGVDSAVARAVLPQDGETEQAAAVAFARRRRIGPFRRADAEPDSRRELGMMARAGFTQEIASQVLRLEPDAAEAMLNQLKQS